MVPIKGSKPNQACADQTLTKLLTSTGLWATRASDQAAPGGVWSILGALSSWARGQTAHASAAKRKVVSAGEADLVDDAEVNEPVGRTLAEQ
jgi:hypothetical protein